MKPLPSLAPLVCALGLLLSACAEHPEYRLSQVLPDTVTPGEAVTAYGKLPPDPTVTLGGTVLEATPVPGGLRFTVPPRFVAGQHPLRVRQGSAQLGGTVRVLPRVDAAALEGNVLRVRGAGWPLSPGELAQAAVRLELDGVKHTPSLEGESLVAVLPPAAAYGLAQLKVWAGGEVSAPYALLREAGAARGSVELPGAGPAQAQRAPGPALAGPRADPRALVVYHRPGALQTLGPQLPGLARRQALRLRGLEVTRLVFGGPEQARQARDLLGGRPGVWGVEEDRLAVPLGSPSVYVHLEGRSKRLQPATTPQPPAAQWHLPLMGLPQAWERGQGEGVVVAVVDTGVVLEHPDLQANLLPGYDFVEGDPTPQDVYGHGTHVAGLVAANGTVVGAAPRARVLPVRVIRDAAGGSAFTVAQGVLWAAGLLEGFPNPHKAQVINLSLGLEGSSQVIEAAVQQAMDAGVLVVAAAGNAGVAALASPASRPGVLSVTAVSGPVVLYPAWYANYGPGLQVAAYGGDLNQDQDRDGTPDGILSTDRNPDGSPGYGLKMGTSMAAPLVSGLAALALAGGAPPALLRQTLTATAVDLGVTGYDTRFGHGLAVGRAAGAVSPRAYVLALDARGDVRGWTLVQPDSSYLLGNLPPGEPLSLLAASDADGDGVVAEAGELVSAVQPFTPVAGQTPELPPLTLTPSDGSGALSLK